MTQANLPVLYSFRRCPYAMRARLAVASAGVACELREIVLRDKAPEFLAVSQSGTVPMLMTHSRPIEESFDIMLWALAQNDPENWLTENPVALDLIAQADGAFKTALDRYKYASRYAEGDRGENREAGAVFLRQLDVQLTGQAWLFGKRENLADMAILPFVRQFANVDKTWFDAEPWPNISRWLEAFLVSHRFEKILTKYPKWVANDPVTVFPDK